MHVRDVNLLRAPGLPDGLRLESLGPGLNIVVGPNATGKSTLSRTIRGALWPSESPEGCLASTTWLVGADLLEADLAHGESHWQPTAPTLPPEDSAGRYALDLGLLLAAQKTDERFAKMLAVELSGGYDLAAAEEAFTRTGVVPTTLARHRDEARARIHTATSATDELVAAEERLPSLREALNRARSANDLLRHAERAAELSRKRDELTEWVAKVEQLPAGLGDLGGSEQEDLQALRERMETAANDLSTAEQSVASGGAARAALEFPDVEPTENQVEVQRGRALRLGERERALEQARNELAAATRRESRARAVLLSTDTALDEIPEESLRQLEALIADRAASLNACEAERSVSRAFRARLIESDDDPSQLRRAIEALRRWLRASPGAHHPAALPAPWIVAVTLACGLGLLVLGFMRAEVALAAIGGASLGVGALLLARRVSRRAQTDGAADRLPLQREVSALGLAPESWGGSTVDRLLPELEERLRHAEETRHLEGRLAETGERISELEADLKQREQALAASTEALGLASGVSSLGVLQQASALREWLDARHAVAGATGSVGDLDRTVRAALEVLYEWIVSLAGASPEDATAAATAIEGIDRRRRDLGSARTLLETHERTSERAQEEADAVEAEFADFWTTVGVPSGDDVALRARMALHAEWRLAEEGRANRARDVGALESTLARVRGFEAWGIQDATDLTTAAALALRDTVAGEAGRLEELSADIRTIEDDLEGARGGTSMEEARAQYDEASAAVETERERAAHDLLSRLVLEDARSAHEIANAPPVLARAQHWFSRFTHHAFRLWVDTDDETRFTAKDMRTGARRELEQLSDATRVQLLLAARLAAIQEAEGASGPLPLCLDEVLATTDQSRFRVIAESLLELADQGRQVLYFTADYAEAAAWARTCVALGREAPKVFDLGELGGDDPGWADEGAAVVATLPEIPAAEGRTPEEYASILGVPAPYGHRPIGDWHLIHVLFDRLDALHVLIQARLDRVGPWRAACVTGTRTDLVDVEVLHIAAARARLLEATLELWRVGRGRPIEWEDVEASGAVSPTFVERVQELLSSHANDAHAFLDKVWELKRFRAASHEQLKDHLVAEGVLDTRPPLEPGVIAQRALERAASTGDMGPLEPVEATAYVLGILALLD